MQYTKTVILLLRQNTEDAAFIRAFAENFDENIETLLVSTEDELFKQFRHMSMFKKTRFMVFTPFLLENGRDARQLDDATSKIHFHETNQISIHVLAQKHEAEHKMETRDLGTNVRTFTTEPLSAALLEKIFLAMQTGQYV